MKRFNRFFAFGLALLLAFGCMGCSRTNKPSETPAPVETPAPAPVETPAATPVATEPPAPDAGELLAALDLALFKKDMESDPFTLKLTLKDPEALGIPMPEATWGELSYDETKRYAEEYGAFLAASVICGLPVVGGLRSKVRVPDAALRIVGGVCLLALTAVAISYVVIVDYNPFIYFNF